MRILRSILKVMIIIFSAIAIFLMQLSLLSIIHYMINIQWRDYLYIQSFVFRRSALQTLHKVSGKAREQNYFLGGLSHDWVSYYEQRIESDRSCLNEWHAMDNLESKRPPSPDSVRTKWVNPLGFIENKKWTHREKNLIE